MNALSNMQHSTKIEQSFLHFLPELEEVKEFAVITILNGDNLTCKRRNNTISTG
jgi:hypothetical protein